ncbi:MAG: fibronectin type III domain-containing protein, partial [Thermoplasmata archaeon]
VTVGNVRIYTVTGLTNGQTYYFIVSAINAAGEGAKSNEVSATPYTVPSAPLSLEATAGNGNVTLKWREPETNGGSQIIFYRIYRRMNTTNFTKIAEVNTTSYLDKHLTNGEKYYYKVTAVNIVGEGEGSEISAIPCNVPAKVRNLQVITHILFIALKWDEPDNGGANITAYRIYRWTDDENETIIEEIDGNKTFYTDTNVTAGKTYHYRVSAVNAAGEGEKSNEVSATVETGEGIVTGCLLVIITAIVVGIVIVVLIIYLIVRNKKQPQTPPQPPTF